MSAKEEKCSRREEKRRRGKSTHFYSDKPAAAVSASNVLISLTVLLEMHIEVVLHALLAKDGIGETNTTLFTLRGETVVQELDDVWSFSGTEAQLPRKRLSTKVSAP
jgi:hypothetical protein